MVRGAGRGGGLPALIRRELESRPGPAGPITVVLPMPPSANRYWRHWGARPVVSPEALEYKATVGLCALAAGITTPFTGPVALSLEVYRAIKKGDLSNRVKVLEDALQGHAYLDDDQVVEIHCRRHDDPDDPRVEVTVAPAPWAVTESIEQESRDRERQAARRRARRAAARG